MSRVAVTDHALIRWLERHHGIALDDVRRELSELAQPFYDVKAKHFKIGEVWIVMEGSVVRTVLPNKPPSGEGQWAHDMGKLPVIESPFKGDIHKMLKRRHG